MAPSIIDDGDITLFEDVAHKKHKVEMHGERTIKGVYFKVKDVGRVFGTETLADDIQLKNVPHWVCPFVVAHPTAHAPPGTRDEEIESCTTNSI